MVIATGTVLVLAVLAIALVAVLVVALVLPTRVGRRTSTDTRSDGGAAVRGGADADLRRDMERLRTELAAELAAGLAAARAETADALRHVAVVRYDAFGDMGGHLSFSAALLDDTGDGLVLTSINGRSETRTYAKGVVSGASEHSLSPEEKQAILHATRPVAPPPSAPAGRRRANRG